MKQQAEVRQLKEGGYVVIDDEMFDICGERCNVIPQENVVVTDFKKGLTEEKAKEAIIKLKECNGSSDYV